MGGERGLTQDLQGDGRRSQRIKLAASGFFLVFHYSILLLLVERGGGEGVAEWPGLVWSGICE